MDQHTQPRKSILYSHDLIGGIRSHLAGLQGYDVMARHRVWHETEVDEERTSSC